MKKDIIYAMNVVFGGPFSWLGFLGIELTRYKVVIALAIVLVIAEGHHEIAGIGVILWLIVDTFDGVIFRRSSQEFQEYYGFLRRVADAVGDRISAFVILFAMVKMADLPLYIYSVELGREVILVSLIGYSWVTRRPITEPNNFSRVAGVCTGLSASSWLLGSGELAVALITLTGVLGAVGLRKYHDSIKD